jgi:alanyl-tRNA synthetase
MQVRSGNEIRELFLRFFESKGHRRVASSSLVPHNDPTLLFANAGMNQFKDLVSGRGEARVHPRDHFAEMRARRRQAQRPRECRVHAAASHVLRDAGQLQRSATTSSAMRSSLRGSWSRAKSGSAFPRTVLYVTIFEGADGVPRDDEAEQYLDRRRAWRRSGSLSTALKDNFWQMGETGPCGPCSEIFYDMGIEAAETPGVG